MLQKVRPPRRATPRSVAGVVAEVVVGARVAGLGATPASEPSSCTVPSVVVVTVPSVRVTVPTSLGSACSPVLGWLIVYEPAGRPVKL
jgi:hypothetical protein